MPVTLLIFKIESHQIHWKRYNVKLNFVAQLKLYILDIKKESWFCKRSEKSNVPHPWGTLDLPVGQVGHLLWGT